MDEAIDNYCERIGPGLLAEPLNAVTNLAFIVVAVVIYRQARHMHQLNISTGLLLSLLTAIGIGSGLFHTFAQRWAELMDVIPIALFQMAFLTIYLRQIALLRPPIILVILSVFIGSIWLAGQFPELMNGSLVYAPAISGVFILALYHRAHAQQEHNALLKSCVLFCFALSFRTMDQAICEHLPIGTHFLWHLCNALVLYFSMRGLLFNLPQPDRLRFA